MVNEQTAAFRRAAKFHGESETYMGLSKNQSQVSVPIWKLRYHSDFSQSCPFQYFPFVKVNIFYKSYTVLSLQLTSEQHFCSVYLEFILQSHAEIKTIPANSVRRKNFFRKSLNPGSVLSFGFRRFCRRLNLLIKYGLIICIFLIIFHFGDHLR